MTDFACPRCKTVLKAPDEKAGEKIACPKCQQRLQFRGRPGIRQCLAFRLGVNSTGAACLSGPHRHSRRHRSEMEGVDHCRGRRDRCRCHCIFLMAGRGERRPATEEALRLRKQQVHRRTRRAGR